MSCLLTGAVRVGAYHGGLSLHGGLIAMLGVFARYDRDRAAVRAVLVLAAVAARLKVFWLVRRQRGGLSRSQAHDQCEEQGEAAFPMFHNIILP